MWGKGSGTPCTTERGRARAQGEHAHVLKQCSLGCTNNSAQLKKYNCTNTFVPLHKYICTIAQIHLYDCTNSFVQLHKYICTTAQIHLHNCTNMCALQCCRPRLTRWQYQLCTQAFLHLQYFEREDIGFRSWASSCALSSWRRRLGSGRWCAA